MKLSDETAKKNPFSVPGDYFESLADRTMAAIREEEAGRQEGGQQPESPVSHPGDAVRHEGAQPLMPTMSQPGDSGSGDQSSVISGQAPDQAEGIAWGMTTGHTGKPVRVVNLRPFLALAAAILGFAILAAAMVRLVSSDRPGRANEAGTSLYAELAAEEIDLYMLENELNMTETVTPELTEEAVASETIIEYLMTEDIDLNEIYELL